MRQRHKFVMQFPGRLGFCSTTVAIKVLFLLVSLLLLVLFLQNMFYAVYAKFNLHEIRLVHQQSSWNEKLAKMVELHQMTSNLNESQRLRRITLQLSFAHYIFLLSKDCMVRNRPRFFEQVGYETMFVSSENKHFFTKSCHRQTYQIYEQPP